MNETLDDIIEYLKHGEGYNKKDVIRDLAATGNSIPDMAIDELDIRWGGAWVGELDEYTDELYSKVIEAVCNVIESYKEA